VLHIDTKIKLRQSHKTLLSQFQIQYNRPMPPSGQIKKKNMASNGQKLVAHESSRKYTQTF